MAFLPPSTLFDHIDLATQLTSMVRAELSAFAERLYAAQDKRVTKAELLSLQRAFWSLISHLEHTPPEVQKEHNMGTAAMMRIRELEMAMGESLLDAFSHSVPAVDLNAIEPDPETLYRFPRRLSSVHNVFPIELYGRTIKVAMSKPAHWEAWLALHAGAGLRPLPCYAPEKEIERALNRYKPSPYDPSEPIPAPMRSKLRDMLTLDEEGLDFEFAKLEDMEQLCADMIGRCISEGHRHVTIYPEKDRLMVNSFTEAWETLYEWPLNLWGPLQLALRRKVAVPVRPYEAEASIAWPFMGENLTIWCVWSMVDDEPQLALSLYGEDPEADEEPEVE